MRRHAFVGTLAVAALTVAACGGLLVVEGSGGGGGAGGSGGNAGCPPPMCPSGEVPFQGGAFCDCHAPPGMLQHCCSLDGG